MIFIIFIFYSVARAAEELPRAVPLQHTYTDEPETMSLAVSQHLVIRLAEAISEDIKYFPDNSANCSIIHPRPEYTTISHCSNDWEDSQSVVTSVAVLQQKQMAYVLDNRLRLRIYELKASLNQKGNVRFVPLQIEKGQSVNGKLLASEDQSTIYLFSPKGSLYMQSDSLLTNIRRLENIEVGDIEAGVVVGNFVYLAMGARGLLVLEILTDRTLRQATMNSTIDCVDICFDKQERMLYILLPNSGVQVYTVDKHGYFQEYDFINITRYASSCFQIVVSGSRLVIAFHHLNRHNVLQLEYLMSVKQISMVRYFKFRGELIDIYIQQGELIAFGNGFIGTFPLGIHPRLIKQQLNGNIQSSALTSAYQYSNGGMFFGLSRHFVNTGVIERSNFKEIRCHMTGNNPVQYVGDLHRKIEYRANMTQCSQGERRYYEYCAYSKWFHIQKMDIVVGHSLASLFEAVKILLIICAASTLVVLVRQDQCEYSYKIYRWRRLKELRTAYEQSKNMIPLRSVRSLRDGAM